jgi:lysozyme
MAAGGIRQKQKGKAVRDFQTILNERAEPLFYPALQPDGVVGPNTWQAFEDLGWALGLTKRELGADEISPKTQGLFADPGKRTAGQLKLATERASKLKRHTIGFDGAPIFWGLAKPLVRARQHGWGGRVVAGDRRPGVPERFGKKSQATLYNCFQRREASGVCPPECGGDCRAANKPGQSSHELRSDGRGFGNRPAGAKLNWWELGIDVEDPVGLVSHLRALGYEAHQTYPGSSEEVQHINFIADPGPVLVSSGPNAAPAKKPALKVLSRSTTGRLKGIDIAEHQGQIDWKKVAASGVKFAYARATEGLNDPDPTFAKNWAQMRSVGIARGAYHFARPAKGRSPHDEVKEFLSVVDRAGGFHPGDLVPMLDLESFGVTGPALSPQQTLEWARAFVHELHGKVGRMPIIYTGSFWRDAMANPADDLGCKLWLAAYVKDPTKWIPTAWAEHGWLMWQYTKTGAVPGIGPKVDLDVLKGGSAALERLRM